MAVDPSFMIQQIAEYAVWDHPERPWPDKAGNIPVVPVITRHTPLLAVVWSEVDNRAEDQDIWAGSGTQRVVFSLTAVSQARKTAARMARHLFNAISFNSDLIRLTAEDDSEIHFNEHELEFDQSYIQDGIRIYGGGLPEITEIQTVSEPQSFGSVRMSACYAESRTLMYDPSLDVWKGSIVFIADMYELGEDGIDYIREI